MAPPPVRKSVLLLQWFGILLFAASLIAGVIGIVAKVDLITALMAFLLALVAVPLSILQINKNAFTFILKSKEIGLQLIGTLLLLASLGLGGYNYFYSHRSSETAPTALSTLPPATPHPTTAPTIPPVIGTPIDLFANNGQTYSWDTGQNSVKSGSCDFHQGAYTLTAVAKTQGIGCNTESAAGDFHNFVYQVTMTIQQGVTDGQSGVGLLFRVNDVDAGYQLSFNQSGGWSLNSATDYLYRSPGASPYFLRGMANVLNVRVVDATITVQLNGHDLGTYTDTESSHGFVGMQLTPGNVAATVTFTNAQLWPL